MAFRWYRNFINNIYRSQNHWRMVSEDLQPRRGILSQSEEAWRYLGIVMGIQGWSGRNWITERQRRRETRRML